MLEKVRARKLWRALCRAAKRNPRLRRIHHRLVGKCQQVRFEITGLHTRLPGDGACDVNPENMIWIFGSGRSGSTWLRSIMEDMNNHRVWEEPMVGRLFGEFYARALEENLRSADFIMGDPIRKGWIRSIRKFVLDGARYSNLLLDAEDYLVIKEPNGSIGAPLLMEALPESRMIILIRDPRDVVASVLDAARKGGWLYETRREGTARQHKMADKNPDAFVGKRAATYRQSMENAKLAYNTHSGPKVLIRYEDLRADTLGEMRRIYSSLGIPADGKELSEAVMKHSWENVPEEEKGEGKFYRKAKPGSWKEDLTPEQAETVERITAPLLKEFYPECEW
jgi:hypothetical protein